MKAPINIERFYKDKLKGQKRREQRILNYKRALKNRGFDNLHAQTLLTSYARLMTFKRLSIPEIYECIKLENRELRMYLVTELCQKWRRDRYTKAFYEVNPNYSKD